MRKFWPVRFVQQPMHGRIIVDVKIVVWEPPSSQIFVYQRWHTACFAGDMDQFGDFAPRWMCDTFGKVHVGLYQCFSDFLASTCGIGVGMDQVCQCYLRVVCHEIESVDGQSVMLLFRRHVVTDIESSLWAHHQTSGCLCHTLYPLHSG